MTRKCKRYYLSNITLTEKNKFKMQNVYTVIDLFYFIFKIAYIICVKCVFINDICMNNLGILAKVLRYIEIRLNHLLI